MPDYLDIIIKDSDVNSSDTMSGFYLDEIAKALDRWDSLEMEDNNLEFVDSAQQYVIDSYDYETAYIDYLNKNPQELKSVSAEIWRGFQKSNLLAGAYFALEHPVRFGLELETFKTEEQERALDRNMLLDPTRSSLGEECEKATAEAQEDLYETWLKGDYREDGLLTLFSKRLTDERGNVETVDDEAALRINATRDQIADFCELDDKEYAELDDNGLKARFKSDVIGWVQNNAYGTVRREKAEIEERRKRNAEVREYQARMAAEREQARRAKLEGMKKGK